MTYTTSVVLDIEADRNHDTNDMQNGIKRVIFDIFLIVLSPEGGWFDSIGLSFGNSLVKGSHTSKNLWMGLRIGRLETTELTHRRDIGGDERDICAHGVEHCSGRGAQTGGRSSSRQSAIDSRNKHDWLASEKEKKQNGKTTEFKKQSKKSKRARKHKRIEINSKDFGNNWFDFLALIVDLGLNLTQCRARSMTKILVSMNYTMTVLQTANRSLLQMDCLVVVWTSLLFCRNQEHSTSRPSTQKSVESSSQRLCICCTRDKPTSRKRLLMPFSPSQNYFRILMYVMH